MARATLKTLALLQGQKDDPFRDEEPGKILHELRFGELTAFEERPHSPYYGTADATPLFLVLLDEVERWTGNVDLVRGLEAEARAALAWIDDYGDRDKDGYVEYERRNTETGLENQCWKDSWNSILFADGTLASGAIATCEIQGYVYDAKRRCARLAREVWDDPELAACLEDEAAALKERFNEDFWLPERQFFALALDGAKRQVDSLTSNIGHLLWSGIVDDDKAGAIARHLLGPQLFSGWGIRTMAEGERGYNPLGYHVGTVWPHDSSLIAAGLARYGYRDEAARIAFAVLEAAAFFRHRLPEVFAGYPRAQTGFPVEYPTACSPQAWASGAPLLLVTTLLGLEPGPDGVSTDPVLPDGIGRLELAFESPVGVRRGTPAPAPHERRVVAAEDPVPSVASAAEFFDDLERIIEPARTLGIKATYRFDVPGVGSWRLVVDDGRLSVLAGEGQADCTLRMSEEVLLKIVRGEQRPATAFLTGLLTMEGDVALAPKLDKLFSPATAGNRSP
jgi:glycogen debranching enzyme